MWKYYLDLSIGSLLKIKKFELCKYNEGIEYILSKYLLLLNVFFTIVTYSYQCAFVGIDFKQFSFVVNVFRADNSMNAYVFLPKVQCSK